MLLESENTQLPSRKNPSAYRNSRNFTLLPSFAKKITNLRQIGPALLHQLYQMLSIRGRSRPKLRLRGEEVPTVDVFVTCCGEDVDVVLDTTRAAAAGDVSLQFLNILPPTQILIKSIVPSRPFPRCRSR